MFFNEGYVFEYEELHNYAKFAESNSRTTYIKINPQNNEMNPSKPSSYQETIHQFSQSRLFAQSHVSMEKSNFERDGIEAEMR